MENELQRLIREKEELERKIAMLTEGKIIMDTVKLDTIKTSSAQDGKWAVYYKYKHIARVSHYCELMERTKWTPIFSCENREEAIRVIPNVIKELKELYEKATHKEE